MKFSVVDGQEVPFSLLLEADPSPESISTYLPDSWSFVAKEGGEVVAACIVKKIGNHIAEIFNISTSPKYQRKGVGSKLLGFVLNKLADRSISKVELGTGTFGYQLTFYQRFGFRVYAVEKDYFLKHYSQPIVEDGIQLKDRLRLYLDI
ncbi:GNAT family N-acetyltransferase [Microbulbifer agarilyticus]|uniref:GNAT family N-acetyltransferase n=1 Tax=Microbulbifer agarilyticus TaxID=260552 RepID=UPI001CD3EED7|nr:GNAT family N-acetyltransferase [Microbulbifer agarilyticus]MCA0894824.1 GNAT family N-acetyltransferase [Microbulbifer agarilyticus]